MEQEEYDTARTKFFESRGLKVIRFWNNEINTNLEGVLMKIQECLQLAPPPNLPPPPKEGEGADKKGSINQSFFL